MTEAERELLLCLANVVGSSNPDIDKILDDLSDTVVEESGQPGWLRQIKE